MRTRIPAVLLALGVLLGVALTTTVPASAEERRPGQVTVLQMNLCLSGLAGCFGGTEYPKVVDEAVERLRENRADAATFNEACSGDVAEIGRRAGYHVAFATVIYNGAPLPCRNPEGRGVFGNAVLSKTPITDVDDTAFAVFNGVEERRLICASTARRFDVCTAHLSTGGEAPGSVNAQQCAELTARLEDREQPTVFGGDVNRRASCAPAGWWTETDAEAVQLPGIQHVYGDLADPRLELEPASYTDHDVMVVRSLLTR
ncbi:endonuclease/exonuclease/phosphatase family protein [Desertihabitans aurantiacus]|uniref:endonuclease/exonuclease/phosphatase family protein n=1 Tax=Desertihabitans aurantiacus TaxID=2282477 RepID=UPI000DF84EE4|nr:endonuclease/exonuclease/phosphatase family protein [Desertihabitans aurantiacus]